MRMRTGVAAAISITVPGCPSLNPIEPAAPTVPHSPAISCLGAFPTPVSERVAGLVIAGVRKPAHKLTSRVLAKRLAAQVLTVRTSIRSGSTGSPRSQPDRDRVHCVDANFPARQRSAVIGREHPMIVPCVEMLDRAAGWTREIEHQPELGLMARYCGDTSCRQQ